MEGNGQLKRQQRPLVVPDEDVESGVRVSAELREPFDVLLGSDLKVVEAGAREMGAKRTADPKVDGPGLAEWVSFQVKGLRALRDSQWGVALI
jgi:hypothetical protein